MANLFRQIQGLLSGPPALVGEVVAVSGSSIRIELPGGALATATGAASVGQTVKFIPGGAVLGVLDALPYYEIEV